MNGDTRSRSVEALWFPAPRHRGDRLHGDEVTSADAVEKDFDD